MVKTDFVELEDGKYYFDGEGHMVTGFMTKWSSRYYFAADGKMAAGTLIEAEDGYVYYANAKGHIVVSDFVDLDDGRHFFDKEGHMVKNATITRWLKKYTFDENGVLIG